jgi:hypothetical protein
MMVYGRARGCSPSSNRGKGNGQGLLAGGGIPQSDTFVGDPARQRTSEALTYVPSGLAPVQMNKRCPLPLSRAQNPAGHESSVMRPARERANQDVIAQARIVLDVGEAAPLRPSPVCLDCQTSPPPVLTSPVEDDG